MSDRWQKFESGGRFGLSSMGGDCADFDPNGGDIGSGTGLKLMAFQTEEAREYFIRADDAQHEAKTAHRELRYFKEALAACFTKSGRIRRRRLMELRAKA